MEDTFINDTVLTVSYTDLQEKSVLVHLLVFLVLFLPHSSFVSVWISQLTSILVGVFFFFPWDFQLMDWLFPFLTKSKDADQYLLNRIEWAAPDKGNKCILCDVFLQWKGYWVICICGSISQGIWWYNQYFLLKTESSCWVASSKLWRKESNGTTIPEKIYESI